MSTPTTPPARPWWRGWTDFWFTPGDPTTIAFVRISTGLLVLYIHLAYSFDLQAFFGKHAWYASAFVERERHESPSYAQPFWAWDQPFAFPRLPDYPHRRQAFMKFLRALPESSPTDTSARVAALAYINRAYSFQNPGEFNHALAYVQQMPSRTEMERYLTALAGNKVETITEITGDGPKKVDISESYKANTPDFYANLSTDERAKVANEVRTLWNLLDGIAWGDAERRGRNYVFNHLVEIPPDGRKALLDFVNSLTKENAAEQKRLLDYLEYWNNDPRVALRTGSNIFSIWFHITDPTQMALVHAAVCVVILMFTLGLFTRVTSVLVWIACVGYIHRTQQVLFGMDTMMNILLFYLMIGNSGAALSLDRLIARFRASRASLARSGTIDANTRAFLACPPPSVNAAFAMRLLQVHFCFIYMAAGLSKLKGPAWWDGRAFWDVVVNPEFTLMQYTLYEEALRAVTKLKPVYYVTISFAVWFTLFIEIATPFLLWTRLRWVVIFLATAMHAIIGVLMGLNLFELLMVVMLLAFLPDRVIRDRFRGGPGLAKLTFAFNPANAAHTRAASLALALDIDNQITLVPDKAATATSVASADGKAATGTEGTAAFTRGLRLLSMLSWLLWVPGVRALLTRRLFPR